MNHSAFCSCNDGLTGDPFKICYEIEDEDSYDEFLCGPYSKFVNVTSVDDSYCLCLSTFRGRPPNCTFIDCYSDNDCGWNENCDFNECVDPCDPNPCGPNSNCRSGGHIKARCSCIDGYFPEPYVGCRRMRTSDGLTLRFDKKCDKICGMNAFCNNNKICSCTEGYFGNPHIECSLIKYVKSDQICTPNPCGPYSKCTVTANNTAYCSCLPGFISEPPNCSPCNDSQDCHEGLICTDKKCTENLCDNFCGYQASCDFFDGKIECYCEEINKYNPYMECPKLVDTDHICANANKHECGVKLDQIFKQKIFYELYDDEE